MENKTLNCNRKHTVVGFVFRDINVLEWYDSTNNLIVRNETKI